MVSLILVGRPKSLHIMAQAMAPSNLTSRWSYCKMEDGLSRRAGGHAARWIIAEKGDRDVRLVRTRNYVGRQTAFYADWLLFREPEFAHEFLRSFPRLQTSNRLESLQHERKALAEKVDERLRRGGFDLSKSPDAQRWLIARRYIEAHDKLRDLAEHAEQLALADGLRFEWMSVLGDALATEGLQASGAE